MKAYNIYLISLLFPFFIFSQTSLNMEQIGNLEYDQDLNDVWGYVAPNGEEHALVGCANGFSYVIANVLLNLYRQQYHIIELYRLLIDSVK